MDRATLVTELERGRRVSVSPQTWRVAAVLAGLRVAVNDPIRSSDRDRGEAKNWLADIWGAIGELVALRVLGSITDCAVTHRPIDFERSVDDVDLVVAASDGPLRLEAKAHLLERGKSWFMINRRARDRSSRRGAIGYIPMLSALGAQCALVGGLIPIDQVNAWGAPDKVLRDPAVGLKLTALAREQFGMPLSDIQATVTRGPRISRAELTRIATSAGEDLDGWQARLPALEDLPAREVVRVTHELLQSLDALHQ